MKMQIFHWKNHRAGKNMLEILAPNTHRRFSLKRIVPVPWQERTRLQNSHSRRGGVAKRTSTFRRGRGPRPNQVRSRIGGVDNSKIRIPTTGRKQTFLATAQLPECMFWFFQHLLCENAIAKKDIFFCNILSLFENSWISFDFCNTPSVPWGSILHFCKTTQFLSYAGYDSAQ